MVAKNLLFRLYQFQDEKTTLYHSLSNSFSKQEKVERHGNMIKYILSCCRGSIVYASPVMVR